MKSAPLRVFVSGWLALLLAPSQGQGDRPPLSPAEVAGIAYQQGFRGGSLVAAVATALAESSLDPDAVSNNLHVLDGIGNPTYHPDGKPVIASIAAYDGSILALNSTAPLPAGGQGRVIGHCRGLWQINSSYHPSIAPADCFDPKTAARRAWGISRKGRFWGKWTSVMTGAAWNPARLATAREAARTADPGVLPPTVPAGLRVEAWMSGGGVRGTPGGTFLREITKGDSGSVLAGPVVAPITEGIQTSSHLWYHVQWDHGTTGWVVEEYLRGRDIPVQSASPAYDPVPANGTVRVPVTGTTLGWTVGGNTKQLSLRFGTDPALAAPGTLRLSGGRPVSWASGPLAPYQNYYWRIDSEGGSGAVTQGPTWTFRTAPVPAPTVTLANVQVSPSPAAPGQIITLTGTLASPVAQTVIIGASAGGHGDPARDLVFSIPGGNVVTSFSRGFQLPPPLGLGLHTLELAAWQDLNQDGKIRYGDVRLGYQALPGAVNLRDLTLPALANLSASPATTAPNQPVQLSATASDAGGSGLAGVYFYRATGEVAPGSWQLVAFRPATGNGPVTLSATDTPFAEGRYWYEMEAVDQHGNRRRLQAPSTVRVRIPDLAPPVVRWLHPENGMSIPGGVTVSGEATDDRGVAAVFYRVNGGPWIQVFQNFNNWSFLLTSVQGTNIIETRATDTSGKSSAIERLYLYDRGSDFDPTVFDERFGFDNDQLPQRWQLQTNGSTFDNGIIGGRMVASWGGNAGLSANKTVPVWASAVELRFTADPGGSLTWLDSGFRLWQIRYRDNPRVLEIGRDGDLRQLPLDASATRRIRTLWRDGVIEVSSFAPGQPVPAPQAISLPELRLANLSGAMWFRIESGFSTSAAIDEVQLRALRQEDRFAIERHRFVPGGTSQVRWTSFEGRNYVVEMSPTLLPGSWTPLEQTPASGLVTEKAFQMPAGTRRYFRVRELP